MLKYNLVLASSSVRRRQLLEQINIDKYLTIPSNIDESILVNEKPRNYALRMATKKVENISEDLVLGADTVVAVGNRILPKTDDINEVERYLRLLSGRRHTVYGGLCLKSKEFLHTKIIKTIVKFKNLSELDISYYLSTNEWKNKSGGYAIQGLASRYISFISGSYTNVVGMDTHTVYKWLEKYGY